MNAAIEKTKKEMESNKENLTYKRVGEYLISLVNEHGDSISEKIMVEGKTLKGAIDSMRKAAKKIAVANVGTLTDDEGFTIIRKYFGINDSDIAPKQKSNVLDFDLNSFI